MRGTGDMRGNGLEIVVAGGGGGPASSKFAGAFGGVPAVEATKAALGLLKLPAASAAAMLEGTWAPPPRNPPGAVAASSRAEQMQSAARRGVQLRPRLCHSARGAAWLAGAPVATPLDSSQGRAQGGGSRVSNDRVPGNRPQGGSCSSRSSATSSPRRAPGWLASAPLGAAVDGRSHHASGDSGASHATTPSWRSRSFPRRLVARTGTDVSVDEQSGTTASSEASRVRRLPPLPMEARWASSESHRRGAPSSELHRLDEVDSEVCEANAMLVESFLNVKRWRTAEENTPADDQTSCSGLGSLAS